MTPKAKPAPQAIEINDMPAPALPPIDMSPRRFVEMPAELPDPANDTPPQRPRSLLDRRRRRIARRACH